MRELKTVLVVGGAGYIGSHMVKCLLGQSHRVVVLDNLVSGQRFLLDKRAVFVQGDCSDKSCLREVFSNYNIDVVMHFASFIQVGESIRMPAKYYRNNFSATLNLLDVMREFGVSKFIFSSTAAVYGEPQYTPIDEKHPVKPINPYGSSKAAVEQVLRDYCAAYQLSSVSFRYFNAAGADADGCVGELHEPETHLIPLVLRAALGQNTLSVYGDDYPTGDGTCIRDYIHVTDLCSAHYLAFKLFQQQQPFCEAVNLGGETGFSVKQVIRVAEKITKQKIPYKIMARRSGDPAILVASAEKAKKLLGWQPRHSSLEQIITDAWAWELKCSLTRTQISSQVF